MNVYVCELFSVPDSCREVFVFATERDAEIFAVNEVVKFMQSLDCDDQDVVDSEWHDAYLAVTDYQARHEFKLALETFADWNDDINFEYGLTISIYCTEVRGQTQIQQPVISKASPDVPCKQCGKGVQPNESACWWCGVSEPARGRHGSL